MAKPLVFSSGVPTAPDVMRLCQAFTNLAEGTLITKDQVAQVLREPVDSSRFGTVVAAWRRKLFRDSNVFLRAEPGKGYVVANPEERVLISGAKFKAGRRLMQRAATISATTDAARLSDASSKAAAHIVSVSAQIASVMAVEARKLKMTAAVARSLIGTQPARP